MNRLERLSIWFVTSALAAAAIAWIAFQVQQEGIAPAVLFPLLVGAVLGAALAGIGRLARVPRWPAAAITAACLGLLVVVAQDYIGHRYRMRQVREELNRGHPLAGVVAGQGEMLPTFADHLADTWGARPVWWTLDLALTAAAAGAVAALASRGIPPHGVTS